MSLKLGVQQHLLFQVNKEMKEDRRNPFALVNLPCGTDQQKEALPDVRKLGFSFNPLPVYNPNGDLLYPRLYSTNLPNSVAAVKFTLSRKYNVGNRKFQYFTNIRRIDLITNIKVLHNTDSETLKLV